MLSSEKGLALAVKLSRMADRERRPVWSLLWTERPSPLAALVFEGAIMDASVLQRSIRLKRALASCENARDASTVAAVVAQLEYLEG